MTATDEYMGRPNPDYVRVVVGWRVRNYLHSGTLFQAPDDLDHHGYGRDGQRLVGAVSRTRYAQPVTMSKGAATVLAELAGYMLDSSRDDAGWDPAAKADVASARRLLQQLYRKGIAGLSE